MIRCGECVILYTNAGNRIPQGSILRLVLFNIFINCLEEFAGDVKMGGDTPVDVLNDKTAIQRARQARGLAGT